MALPSPPFVDIPGLKNFRDLGGYPVPGQPGKVVKRNLVFRASEPSKVTDEGISKLNALGITHVYDLRSEMEIQRDAASAGRQVKVWQGAERVFVPVFRDHDYSPAAIAQRYSGYSSEGTEVQVVIPWIWAHQISSYSPSRRSYFEWTSLALPPISAPPSLDPAAHPLLQQPAPGLTPCCVFVVGSTSAETNPSQGFVRIYQDILAAASAEDHPHAPFTTILEHLSASDAPTPLLVHCTAGKDRTGVICALILSLCGVEDEAVAHEYSLTELGLQERKEEFINMLIQGDALRADRAGAERMVSSRKESMLATLAMIREKYGSVEKLIIDQFRISPEAIAQIRRNLVVDLQDGEQPLDWKSHAELVP